MQTKTKYDEEKVVYAGFIPRWIAFTIDNAIFAVITILLLLPFPFFEDPLQVAIQRTLSTLLLVGVILYMWVKLDGATPGKKLMKIKVVDAETFENINFKQAVKRFLGYIVSSVPFLLGFVVGAFTKKRQTLHDKIANTVVIDSDSLTPHK